MKEQSHKSKNTKHQQGHTEPVKLIDPREDPELRAKNIKLFWYYLNSVLLPIIFISVLGVIMSIKGITIEDAESIPSIIVAVIYSVLLYLNFLLVRGFSHRWAHFVFGVVIPTGTFLILTFFLR